MTNLHTRRRIVFDLDGTLVDSAPDLSHALNHVLGEMGREPVPLEDVRHMVGQGAKRLIEQGLASTGGTPDAFEMDGALAAFLDYYRDHIADTTRAFPGARDLLEDLRVNGFVLGLCTNKPQALTDALMDTLKLSPFFSASLGGDALPVRKPDRRHLDETLRRMPGDGDALMIGDTLIDVRTARAAGIPVVAVGFGYSEIDPNQLGADRVITDFSELRHLLLPEH